MPIEETVYSVLSAAAGVTSLVPADRIKPPGNWQYMTRPYIIHRPVTSRPTHVHSAVTLALINHNPNYQINAVADSYSSGRAVVNAIKAAIFGTTNGNHGGTQFFLRNEMPLPFDPDRKIIEFALDYEIFWL
jgi:hypothetical protein